MAVKQPELTFGAHGLLGEFADFVDGTWCAVLVADSENSLR